MYYKALELREQGLSYKEIADSIGSNKRTVYDWCNGRRDPTKLKGKSNVSDEEFKEIVAESFSVAQCLKKQGLKPSGGNYSGFDKRVERLNLNTDHFTGQGHLKGKTHNWAAEVPVEEAFVENGSLSSFKLNKKIQKYDLKPYVCEVCGINEWSEQKLSLHLDHINGINNDNRLSNLRFLCPNCHSLTDSYCGKNKKRK